MLGGAQSLHCNSRDEALALPTEESATLALRTQQIIAHESGVANSVDPVGGSYEIESRTNEIERDAIAVLNRIDAAGGTLTAIESGLIQREIQESAFRAQRAIDSGESTVVGVTAFQTDEGATIPTFTFDPEVERVQQARVASMRAARDADEVCAPRSTRSATPRPATPTSFRSSSPPSDRTQQWGKSRIRYGRCSAKRLLFSSRGPQPTRCRR